MCFLMNKGFVFFYLIFIFSCNTIQKKNKVTGIVIALKYCKNLLISQNDSNYFLYSIENNDTQFLFDINKNRSMDKIIVLSSVFYGGLKLLNEEKRIIGVDNFNYYYDSTFIENSKKNNISSVGEEGQLNLEKIIELNPEMIICNSSKSIQNYSRLKGVKIIPCISYKENHPLARAEWIKFFGIICGQFDQSVDFFNQVEKQYNQLKDSSSNIKNTFFCELLYGNTWNIPGGNSYMANLIQDAGGTYMYSNKRDNFTFQLSFEEVYTDCRNSEIWINPGLISKKSELIALDNRFKHFKAFKKGNLFNNNKKTRSNGANDYWETGPYRPDVMLKDLMIINELNEENFSLLQYFKKVD